MVPHLEFTDYSEFPQSYNNSQSNEGFPSILGRRVEERHAMHLGTY